VNRIHTPTGTPGGGKKPVGTSDQGKTRKIVHAGRLDHQPVAAFQAMTAALYTAAGAGRGDAFSSRVCAWSISIAGLSHVKESISFERDERPTSNQVFCRFMKWWSAATTLFDVQCSTFGVRCFNAKRQI
jgi:hypothetical protein